MNITLPADHPLALAIEEHVKGGTESWLVLKTPTATPYSSYRSSFRACIKAWKKTKLDDAPATVTVELETWEEHMDRKAYYAGL